jgi:microsomal epoxide hydrolase
VTHCGSRRRALLGTARAGALLLAGGARVLAQAIPGAAPDPDGRASVLTSDGVELSLLERRPADPAAQTLVFLPGWCMPATIWRAQLLEFGARWRTVAMDPRGQGRSQVPEGGYTVDRRADDLHDVLQAVSAQGPAVVVAWSLGVLEALQYVQRHGSARLGGLALVDNSIGEPPAPRSGYDLPGALRKARATAVDRFVRSLFARPPPDGLVEEIRASAMRMPLEASIALLSYPLPREHWREIVEAFDRPLAYLVTPRLRSQSENLRRAQPRARVEVFEHAGHALFVDEAQHFNGVLAGWLQGLGRPSGAAS